MGTFTFTEYRDGFLYFSGEEDGCAEYGIGFLGRKDMLSAVQERHNYILFFLGMLKLEGMQS